MDYVFYTFTGVRAKGIMVGRTEKCMLKPNMPFGLAPTKGGFSLCVFNEKRGIVSAVGITETTAASLIERSAKTGKRIPKLFKGYEINYVSAVRKVTTTTKKRVVNFPAKELFIEAFNEELEQGTTFILDIGGDETPVTSAKQAIAFISKSPYCMLRLNRIVPKSQRRGVKKAYVDFVTRENTKGITVILNGSSVTIDDTEFYRFASEAEDISVRLGYKSRA